jgi:hypothetical protein
VRRNGPVASVGSRTITDHDRRDGDHRLIVGLNLDPAFGVHVYSPVIDLSDIHRTGESFASRCREMVRTEDPRTAGDQGARKIGGHVSANGSSSYDWITCGRAGSDRQDQQVER